jgi:hypothetical protein
VLRKEEWGTGPRLIHLPLHPLPAIHPKVAPSTHEPPASAKVSKRRTLRRVPRPSSPLRAPADGLHLQWRRQPLQPPSAEASVYRVFAYAVLLDFAFSGAWRWPARAGAYAHAPPALPGTSNHQIAAKRCLLKWPAELVGAISSASSSPSQSSILSSTLPRHTSLILAMHASSPGTHITHIAPSLRVAPDIAASETSCHRSD